MENQEDSQSPKLNPPQEQEKIAPPQEKPPQTQEKPVKKTTKGKGWQFLIVAIILIFATASIICAVKLKPSDTESNQEETTAENTDENQPPENEQNPQDEENLYWVTEVVDGDTVIIEGGTPLRLLGINADEEGSPCYNDAKKRLEELVLNKKVELIKDTTEKDQYDRLLRYIFLDNQNINLQLVKEGMAICEYYEPDIKYKEDCAKLEEEAKNSKTGCKWQEKIVIELPTDLKWENLTAEKTGLEVIEAEEAKNQIGTEKIVEGTVASTKRGTNPALYINFCKPYPEQCFTAIVWNSDYSKFPIDAEILYYQKAVRVKGYIEEYKGVPEIIITDPSQIEIGK